MADSRERFRGERPEKGNTMHPSPAEIARESGPDSLGQHQVWHLIGYPESRIAWLVGAFEPRFPDHYVHVANVQASSLSDAAALTMHQGSILDGTSKSWTRNPGTQALVLAPRSTDSGDVIVDFAGAVFQMDRYGFRTITAATEPQPLQAESARALLTPSDIARLEAVEAASAIKQVVQGKPIEVNPERSGQLSPPHTPRLRR